MADRNTKTNFVKAVFGIPDWYILSEMGEERLFKYICETRNIYEANLFRVIDCSTNFVLVSFVFFQISRSCVQHVTLSSGTKLKVSI